MSETSDIEASAVDGGHSVSEDEDALWTAFKESGSLSARDQLFSRYAAFARKLAQRHHRERSWGDIELADLYQHAYTGLLEALDRFEPLLGAPFPSFAARRISGSIRDGIVHLSEMREQLSWRHRLHRERINSLSESGSGGPATPIEKLAELAMGLALGFMLEGTGLVAEAADERDAAAAGDTAYDSLAWKDVLTNLHEELQTLPDREQAILRQHYFNGLNFDQLAAFFAVSKGRISQLHKSALLTLRKRMRAQGHFRMER
jgi:RNA polymerase sigma factor for flagellar operon FliA